MLKWGEELHVVLCRHLVASLCERNYGEVRWRPSCSVLTASCGVLVPRHYVRVSWGASFGALPPFCGLLMPSECTEVRWGASCSVLLPSWGMYEQLETFYRGGGGQLLPFFTNVFFSSTGKQHQNHEDYDTINSNFGFLPDFYWSMLQLNRHTFKTRRLYNGEC